MTANQNNGAKAELYRLAGEAVRRALGTREGWCNSGNARDLWRVSYRDWREYARISCGAFADLVVFRGFGVLKTAYATDCITHVGRVRVNNLNAYDYRELAERLGMKPSDYNPSRRLAIVI